MSQALPRHGTAGVTQSKSLWPRSSLLEVDGQQGRGHYPPADDQHREGNGRASGGRVMGTYGGLASVAGRTGHLPHAPGLCKQQTPRHVVCISAT